MKVRLVVLSSLLLCSLAFATRTAAQAPVCDGICTPNMGSPSYAGAAAARVKPLNARGHRNPTVMVVGGPKIVPAITNTVVGSQSYN